MLRAEIPEWAELVSSVLLQALKERDPYTYGHCMRVAKYARLLAKAAGFNHYDQKVAQYASIFHDLGKISIPDRVLLKPGRLNQEEESIMRLHPVKSTEILKPLDSVPFFSEMTGGIRHHHERMDGQGYPDGIAGDKIPILARLIAIVDTFDAMTTTRPYRKGGAEEFAYKEIKQFAGRQFDAHLVKIFLQAHPTWGDLEIEITEEFVASHFKRAS